MNRKLLIVVLLMCGLSAIGQKKINYVDPMIGTNGMGHTFPGACVPHGLVQLSPDTDTVPHNVNGTYQPRAYEYCAGYQHRDSSIVGFSHTHFNGTGHSDLGDILIMPITGDVKFNPGTAEDPDSGYRSRFTHDTEKASPGYYSVVLEDYDVKAELTATERVGVHKYTFPKGEGHILLDLKHGIYNYDGKVLWANLRVENDTLLTGYRITNGWARVNYTYFAITFSKPIKGYGYQEMKPMAYNGMWRKFNIYRDFPEIGGRNVVAYFDFDLSDGVPLEVKVALSPVRASGALNNLRVETAGRSFEQLRDLAEQKWENALSVVEVEGDYDQTCNIYSSLYHTMINPSLYMDHDGAYRGLDHEIHHADDFINYTVFSVWDTYRALHPLFNLFYPSRSKDIIASFLKHYQQSVHGALPIWSHMANENWCMIGYHGVSVVADAYVKGIEMDEKLALEAVMSNSTIPYLDGLKEYMELGYVPMNKSGNSASVTLEYGYDDWTIYNMARLMGKQEVADKYLKRAAAYKYLVDEDLGFIRPKDSVGKWKANFDVLDTHGQGFIEGNSWNYTFYVPHDVYGLAKLMGGKKPFIDKLQQVFDKGLYDPANEPDIAYAHLFSYFKGEEWRTQKELHRLLQKYFKNAPDGIPGNDDTGTMSTWAIFNMMGFYPDCPGAPYYTLSTPVFDRVEIRLDSKAWGCDKLVIETQRPSAESLYINEMELGGKKLSRYRVSHEELVKGGTLKFILR